MATMRKKTAKGKAVAAKKSKKPAVKAKAKAAAPKKKAAAKAKPVAKKAAVKKTSMKMAKKTAVKKAATKSPVKSSAKTKKTAATKGVKPTVSKRDIKAATQQSGYGSGRKDKAAPAKSYAHLQAAAANAKRLKDAALQKTQDLRENAAPSPSERRGFESPRAEQAWQQHHFADANSAAIHGHMSAMNKQNQGKRDHRA